MTDKPVELDQHRGMAAQKATELRREIAANERTLRARHDALEAELLAAPASNWEEAAVKVRYLLSVLAATPSGQESAQEGIDPGRARRFLPALPRYVAHMA